VILFMLILRSNLAHSLPPIPRQHPSGVALLTALPMDRNNSCARPFEPVRAVQIRESGWARSSSVELVSPPQRIKPPQTRTPRHRTQRIPLPAPPNLQPRQCLRPPARQRLCERGPLTPALSVCSSARPDRATRVVVHKGLAHLKELAQRGGEVVATCANGSIPTLLRRAVIQPR